MFEKMKIRKAKRELKDYIKKVSLKKNREEIAELLLKVGWTKTIIDEVFEEIEKKKKETIEINIPIRKKVIIPKAIEEDEEPIERKPIGIKKQLDEISTTLDVLTQKKKIETKLKEKQFKLPSKVKGKLKKLAIKNKAMVLLLQGTRNISPVLGERKSGMLLVGGNVYDGAVAGTWLWRGKYPTYIVPEWDLKPLNKEGINQMRGKVINASELYDDTIKNKRASEPAQIILRMMEAKDNRMLKSPMNIKTIVWTIIIVIVVMAILFGDKII